MSDWTGSDWALLITAVGGALAGILGWIIRRPGQKETDAVEVAGGVLSVADNTVKMIAGRFEKEFERMMKEQAEERTIHRAEQAEMRRLHQEQVAEERKSTAAIKTQLSEVSSKVEMLQTALREAQLDADNWRTEAEKWRKKYETIANGKGK